MLNLSEQQLVDCAGAFDNHGCNGGLPSHAFEYLMYAGGHESEDDYPYTAVTGTACSYNGRPAARVSAVHNITAYGEDELLSAVGSTGPVSIAFQVSAAALGSAMPRWAFDRWSVTSPTPPTPPLAEFCISPALPPFPLQVSDDFRHYYKGVYDGVCETSPASVNHAVVAVGYGATDGDGTPYWIVRNSWGTSWGLDGYFLIRRGVNKCGLADCASFPEVE
jgi:cathepsin H